MQINHVTIDLAYLFVLLDTRTHGQAASLSSNVLENQRAVVDQWLKNNPPPPEWRQGPYAYAFLEMPNYYTG